MAYTYIQTFFLDPTSVGNAAETLLTSVDLYFKEKPDSRNNSSGIINPGASIIICDADGVNPSPGSYYQNSVSRLSYDSIFSLSDSSIPTTFRFTQPVALKTGKFYGIAVALDDPGFTLWSAKQGDRLVGTNTPSQGAVGSTDGSLYEASNAGTFQARRDMDLKFRVNVAKYTSNTVTLTFVPDSYEFITINSRSANIYQSGEFVIQDAGNTSANVTFYKTGNVSINASSNSVIGIETTFTSTVTANGYITITDGTAGNTEIRKVLFVTNNTFLTLEEQPSFTTASGKYKILPVGELYATNYPENEVTLARSTANSTVKFVSGGVREAAITAGGTLYSNSDSVVISGGGATLNATANLTTNSTGGIISLNLTNTGIGFTSAATVAITTSTGSGATLVVNTSHIGLKLFGVVSETTANIVSIDVKDINQINTRLSMSLPSYATINATHNFTYLDGSTYKVTDTNALKTDFDKVNDITSYEGLLLSRSLEVINTSYLYGNDRSGVVNVAIGISKSNTNLFESPVLGTRSLDLFTFENDVNADSTNEFTNSGNAISKHITTKVAFANSRFAEDLRLYLTAYSPANTEIEVYARLHNSNDSDAFDDKNWTPLTLKDGIGSISSKTDPASWIELGYGLPQYPESNNTITGVVATTADSANIIGSGTSFNTELTALDLIKIYSPIQPQNYQVAVVDSVTNATHITLKAAVVNGSVTESIVGNGFKVDKLKHPHSMFNNILNDNVARYYSTSMVEFDTFDSMQFKIVLLADDKNLVPKIEDIRAIGVSA